MVCCSDSCWDWVDKETKELMGMEMKDDGEFWMNFRDFCRQFQEVTICTTGPDFDGDGVSDQGDHWTGQPTCSLSHMCNL